MVVSHTTTARLSSLNAALMEAEKLLILSSRIAVTAICRIISRENQKTRLTKKRSSFFIRTPSFREIIHPYFTSSERKCQTG